MPESNFEDRLKELDREFEEKVRLAEIDRINKKLPLLLERNQSLEHELDKMKAHNKRIEQINREKKENLYGASDPERGIRGVFEQHFETHPGNHRDAALDFANEYLVPVNIIDENGKEQTLFPYSKEEISNLEKEIQDLRKTYNDNFEERRKNLSQVEKAKREKRISSVNRESQLKEAYKFLTYYDTSTTTGYPNLESLTEDEVLNIYSEFYNKRNEPGYRRVWEETMNRMQKDDREAILPPSQRKPDLNAPDGLKEEELTPESEVFGPPESLKNPEVFGPPTPEGMVENPIEGELNQEAPKQFNNNSTCLLTEGQILALRNRGINVPFNTPGQTKLTEEQIRAINGAGISTVDLTEPGNKTVEELTGIPDPTQPEEKQYKIREYIETSPIGKYFSNNQEVLTEDNQLLNELEELNNPDVSSSKHM